MPEGVEAFGSVFATVRDDTLTLAWAPVDAKAISVEGCCVRVDHDQDSTVQGPWGLRSNESSLIVAIGHIYNFLGVETAMHCIVL